MLKDFNRIYAIEIDLNKLETTYNSNALFANTDLNTSTLLVKLILNGKPLDVADKIVTAYIRTGVDKNITMQKCEFVEDGVVGIDFKNSALKVGTNVFFIEIKSEDGEVINTPLINYKVVELFDVSDSIEGEDDVKILTQLITEVDVSKLSIERNKDEIDNIKSSIEVINEQIGSINSSIDEMKQEVVSTNETVNSFKISLDELVTQSEEDKVDYIGNKYDTLKETNDANVEHILRKVDTQHYEGTDISATNTYYKKVHNAILKGNTKYKDIDTNEILDTFEEGRKLEFIKIKNPTIKISSGNLWDGGVEHGMLMVDTGVVDKSNTNNASYQTSSFIKVPQNTDIYIQHTYAILACEYDENKQFLRKCTVRNNYIITTSDDAHYIRFRASNSGRWLEDYNTIQVVLGTSKLPYMKYNTSELSLNEELDGFGTISDTIDLTKGILTRNVGRYRFTGEEKWSLASSDETHTQFKVSLPSEVKFPFNGGSWVATTNFLFNLGINTVNNTKKTPYSICFGGVAPSRGCYITVGANVTLEEFKEWLVVNKAEIMFKLNTKEVQDYISHTIYSYDGITYYNCKSEENHPSPILSIDVPTDLASLVSTLKHENQQQDELINITMLATDEMLMMLEPLLVNTINLNSKDNNHIVNMYVTMVNRQLKDIEEIPNIYKEKVKEVLGL